MWSIFGESYLNAFHHNNGFMGPRGDRPECYPINPGLRKLQQSTRLAVAARWETADDLRVREWVAVCDRGRQHLDRMINFRFMFRSCNCGIPVHVFMKLADTSYCFSCVKFYHCHLNILDMLQPKHETIYILLTKFKAAWIEQNYKLLRINTIRIYFSLGGKEWAYDITVLNVMPLDAIQFFFFRKVCHFWLSKCFCVM